MASQEMTVKDILAAQSVDLPGGDLGKTLLSMVFPLVLLVVLSDNPLFSSEIRALEPFRGASTLLLIGSLAFAVASGWSVHTTINRTTSEIASYRHIFAGKMFIGLSVTCFFLVVCEWVIVLGGIMSSPFAALLSISPILLAMQFLRDRRADYDAVLSALSPHWTTDEEGDLARSHGRVILMIYVINTLPIGLVLLALLPGQWLVAHCKIHVSLLGDGFCQVLESDWYERVYYTTYYLSVLIAVFGVLPKRLMRRLTAKLPFGLI